MKEWRRQHIVKFIDESEAEPAEKLRLAKILRAQLSSEEQLLLCYNGLSDYGRHRFKPLIEEYSLLEQIDDSQLLSIWHLRRYAHSAWRDKDRDHVSKAAPIRFDMSTPERKLLFDIVALEVEMERLKGIPLADGIEERLKLLQAIGKTLELKEGEKLRPVAIAFIKRLSSWAKLQLPEDTADNREFNSAKISDKSALGEVKTAIAHRNEFLQKWRDAILSASDD